MDALHVLTLFEQVLAPEWGVVEETQAEADEVRYKKLAARLVGELGMDIVHCRYAVDAMLDRERWALGLKAKRLPWRLELIHGRSFVLSLNRVRCLLEALAQEPGVPTDTMRELILTLPRPMDPETRVLPEWSAPAFTVAFGRLVRNLGLRNLRFHDLRHDTASTLTMAGVQQRTVMALLGHRDPRMTLRYQHLSPEHLRDAVRALDKRQTATTVEAVGQA